MSERIFIDVDRDGWTKNLQLNIVKLDENDRGMGFRLAGPKYNGSSMNLLRTELDERDAAEIRAMLNAVFPAEPGPARAEVIAERDAQIIAWLRKKAAEEGTRNKSARVRATVLYRIAGKLSRGAVRPPLSSADAMTLTDAETYSGELAMLRGLLGVLRVVAKHGADNDMREVRRVLAEHASDERAAIARGGDDRG